MSSIRKPRVLLTNDDGPPSKFSPYIFGLWRHLTHDLGWDVKVVIPSSQKSWISIAFQIVDVIHGRYYYPKGPDGMGEISGDSRPPKEGELGEWIMFDGTPATCANIGLHNLYPGKIDLVISGPNLGRNTSAAFAISSGTLGASMSSALSSTRSIALSYGTMKKPKPVTEDLYDPAHALSAKIISHLWLNWGSDPQGLRPSKEIDLYSINVPMITELLRPEPLPIRMTSIWRNGYQRLFQAHQERVALVLERQTQPEAGPDAAQRQSKQTDGVRDVNPKKVGSLVFKWAPDMTDILNPAHDICPSECDARALDDGFVSITPLRASYAQPDTLDTNVMLKL